MPGDGHAASVYDISNILSDKDLVKDIIDAGTGSIDRHFPGQIDFVRINDDGPVFHLVQCGNRFFYGDIMQLQVYFQSRSGQTYHHGKQRCK